MSEFKGYPRPSLCHYCDRAVIPGDYRCPDHVPMEFAPTPPAPVDTSAQRKAEPLWSGCMNYFPRALRAVARVSKKGNDKHNPGQPLHWAKEKSTDQPDCTARHISTPYETDPETGERHLTHGVWRALAWLEIALEATEKGLCTWEDLERGEITIAQLGPRLAGKKP